MTVTGVPSEGFDSSDVAPEPMISVPSGLFLELLAKAHRPPDVVRVHSKLNEPLIYCAYGLGIVVGFLLAKRFFDVDLD